MKKRKWTRVAWMYSCQYGPIYSRRGIVQIATIFSRRGPKSSGRIKVHVTVEVQ